MPFTDTRRWDISRTDWYETQGVYGIFDTQNRCIYVGKTDNLRRRMAEHMSNRQHLMHRYQLSYLLWEQITTEVGRSQRELVLRRELRPLADGL